MEVEKKKVNKDSIFLYALIQKKNKEIIVHVTSYFPLKREIITY